MSLILPPQLKDRFKNNSPPSLTLGLHCEQKKVSLNIFLDSLMSDPAPQCLVWLPLMHRLANVENGRWHNK